MENLWTVGAHPRTPLGSSQRSPRHPAGGEGVAAPPKNHSDCARPPVPTSWFLPHAGLHLATEHSQSQELERGAHCRPVSPPHHLCPHSSDSWKHFFSSKNGVNNTNYCVVVLKCFALSTALILANWTEHPPLSAFGPLVMAPSEKSWSRPCVVIVVIVNCSCCIVTM